MKDARISVMSNEGQNTILIVDDEKINLKILSHILGSDYIIYTAGSGEAAIEKAVDLRPDVILLDIVMPGMDGYETLSELKKCDTLIHTPVIIITGLSSEIDEERGLSLNAADYIAKPFSSTIVKLRVGHQIQIVNQLRTIEKISKTDPLTQLPNRRNFDERLLMEWKMAIREKLPISLLLLDIDKFKYVNDTYGHAQGDKVLQIVSSVYPKAFSRPCDFAARWGGEEFIALLVNTPMKGALDVAERIRSSIEKTKINFESGEKINITVSIGVNSMIPVQDSSLEDFILEADRALYAAKKAGRNKVVAADTL